MNVRRELIQGIAIILLSVIWPVSGNSAQTTDLVKFSWIGPNPQNCNQIMMRVTGVPGTSFVVITSTDMSTWELMREGVFIDWCLFSSVDGKLHTIPPGGELAIFTADEYEFPPQTKRFFRIKLEESQTEHFNKTD